VPALTLADTVVVPESVLSRELEGETVVLNLDTGIYFGLDTVGSVMWTEMRARSPLRAAAAALADAYDAPAAEIERDLLEFAETMLAKGLLKKSPTPSA
jgi:hypothetical protein